MGTLTTLTKLNLSLNQLFELPPEIGRLSALESLQLTNNCLSQLPTELCLLTNLTELLLNYNKLTSIPEEVFSALTALKELALAENDITHLPATIGRMTNLTLLSLQENNLTSVPHQLSRCTSLRQLWLHSNPIPVLPSSLLTLNSLVTPPPSSWSTRRRPPPPQQPQQPTPSHHPKRLLDICCGIVKNNGGDVRRNCEGLPIPRELMERLQAEWRTCWGCNKYFFGDPVITTTAKATKWGRSLEFFADFCTMKCYSKHPLPLLATSNPIFTDEPSPRAGR